MDTMAILVLLFLSGDDIKKYEYPMTMIECMSAIKNAKKSENVTMICVRCKEKGKNDG